MLTRDRHLFADAGTPLPRFSYETPYALFTIQACTAPSSLSIAKTHSGNFSQGQNGATYTLTDGGDQRSSDGIHD